MKVVATTASNRLMAKSYREHGVEKWKEGRRHLRHSEWHEAIRSFQETIEFCSKSTFHSLDLDPPRKHRIDEESFANLRDRLPEKARQLEVGKLYLMSELWGSVYTLAKYGSQTLKVPARSLFNDSAEAKLAERHATIALTIALRLVNSMPKD